MLGPAKDEEEKKQKCEKVINENWTKFFNKLEEGLGKSTWIIGEKLTVADFWVGSFYCDQISNEKSTYYTQYQQMVKQFPNLVRFGEAFKKENSVWLSIRPE